MFTMAEGDRFERAFGAGWRSAYRWAREGVAPTAEVADKLVTALAKTLREMSGVPGLREMEEVVGNAARRLTLRSSGVEEEAAILIESFNALDRVVRDLDGHRNTKIAAEVGKSLLVQQGNYVSGHAIWPLTMRFVENTCTALVEHHFFAIARQNLVAEGKLGNHEQARQWQHSVEEALQPLIWQLAERLAKDPNAKSLRAPNRTVKPQSTSDLLGEVLASTGTPSRSPGRRGR
jgi:hypothetical protein